MFYIKKKNLITIKNMISQYYSLARNNNDQINQCTNVCCLQFVMLPNSKKNTM